jgi:hypothetical protein
MGVQRDRLAWQLLKLIYCFRYKESPFLKQIICVKIGLRFGMARLQGAEA